MLLSFTNHSTSCSTIYLCLVLLPSDDVNVPIPSPAWYLAHVDDLVIKLLRGVATQSPVDSNSALSKLVVVVVVDVDVVDVVDVVTATVTITVTVTATATGTVAVVITVALATVVAV